MERGKQYDLSFEITDCPRCIPIPAWTAEWDQ